MHEKSKKEFFKTIFHIWSCSFAHSILFYLLIQIAIPNNYENGTKYLQKMPLDHCLGAIHHTRQYMDWGPKIFSPKCVGGA